MALQESSDGIISISQALPAVLLAIATFYNRHVTKKSVSETESNLGAKHDNAAEKMDHLIARMAILENQMAKVTKGLALVLTDVHRIKESTSKLMPGDGSADERLPTPEERAEAERQKSAEDCPIELESPPQKSSVKVIEQPKPKVGKVTWKK